MRVNIQREHLVLVFESLLTKIVLCIFDICLKLLNFKYILIFENTKCFVLMNS